MKIVVAPQARDDLKTAYAYIAEDKGGEASSSSRSPSRTSAPPSNALRLSSPPSGTIDCLVAAITSIRPPSLLPGEVPLSPEDQAAGGLLKPSIVKIGKLIALDRRLIRRTLGRLPDATVEALLAEMKRFLIEP